LPCGPYRGEKESKGRRSAAQDAINPTMKNIEEKEDFSCPLTNSRKRRSRDLNKRPENIRLSSRKRARGRGGLESFLEERTGLENADPAPKVKFRSVNDKRGGKGESRSDYYDPITYPKKGKDKPRSLKALTAGEAGTD